MALHEVAFVVAAHSCLPTNEQGHRRMKPKSTKPTHDILLIGEGHDPTNWIKIGSAWEHQDGQGLNLRLDLLPLSTHQRLAIRKRDAVPGPRTVDQ
jgi:hypothetical protein